jgi:hypothetical protein
LSNDEFLELCLTFGEPNALEAAIKRCETSGSPPTSGSLSADGTLARAKKVLSEILAELDGIGSLPMRVTGIHTNNLNGVYLPTGILINNRASWYKEDRTSTHLFVSGGAWVIGERRPFVRDSKSSVEVPAASSTAFCKSDTLVPHPASQCRWMVDGGSSTWKHQPEIVVCSITTEEYAGFSSGKSLEVKGASYHLFNGCYLPSVSSLGNQCFRHESSPDVQVVLKDGRWRFEGTAGDVYVGDSEGAGHPGLVTSWKTRGGAESRLIVTTKVSVSFTAPHAHN